MSENESKEFEQLTARMKELEVNSRAWQREYERVKQEFDELKEKIKNDYGVELSEFDNSIQVLRDEVTQRSSELNRLLDEFEEKTQE